jgi:hypothetical protein
VAAGPHAARHNFLSARIGSPASNLKENPMEVTLTIRYRGPAARAGALVTALEREGARVDWTPPREQRGLGADATAVVVSLVASGAYDGIKAAVTKMREWMPRAEIVIENDPGEDAEPFTPPEPAIRPDVVQALFSALIDMDPGKLAALAETGITAAERKQADELYLASIIADFDQRERWLHAMEIIIGDRKLSDNPSWTDLFDDLTPERAAQLRDLYYAMPDGARDEYDKRYGRPQEL